MKCPRCGNEVSADEAFCGQCGLPTAPQAAPPTAMVQMPPPQSGHLNSYPTQSVSGPQNPANQAPFTNTQSPPLQQQFSAPTPPTQAPASRQQTGFYQDATEAISVLPNNPNVPQQQPFSPMPPTSYPQQGTPISYPQGTPGQYNYQPNQQPLSSQPHAMQSANYARQAYPPQPMQTSQNYTRDGRKIPLPPQKQQNGAIVFIVSICLVVALLSAVGVATLYAMRSHTPTPQNQPVQSVAPTATLAPTPTLAPTMAPTDTPIPTATTPPATPPPDTNFVYCGQPCATDGFSTEYPQTWVAAPLASGTQGIQFANPAAVDQSAVFKALGPTAGAPNDIVQMDLQQNFMSKSGYTVVTPNSTVHIGGETWFREVITYQGTGQTEYVEVYGDVHQGKGFILELQASQDQFPGVNTQYFENITGRFLFL